MRARIELIFQVASFTVATYIAGIRTATGGFLDHQLITHVRIPMKAQNDLSVWSIIERLQRRLERQGMTPATADRALSVALRQIALRA